MKRCVLFIVLLFVAATTLRGQEAYHGELALNLSDYSSVSFSIEKTFHEGRWAFGPRVEYVKLFNDISYEGGDSTYLMNSQLRIRLLQLEYEVNDAISVGLAPFWMLGPLPRNGWYKTPTTLYAEVEPWEDVFIEASITTSMPELIQISFRKRLFDGY